MANRDEAVKKVLELAAKVPPLSKPKIAERSGQSLSFVKGVLREHAKKGQEPAAPPVAREAPTPEKTAPQAAVGSSLELDDEAPKRRAGTGKKPVPEPVEEPAPAVEEAREETGQEAVAPQGGVRHVTLH